MKKALFAFVIMFAVPFSFVHAQSGFTFMQQSNTADVVVASTTGSLFQYTAQYGNGFSGTTTEAFATMHFTRVSGSGPAFELSLLPFTDNSYSTNVPADDCSFSSPSSGSNTSGFLQADVVGTCVLKPQYFYEVVISLANNGTSIGGAVFSDVTFYGTKNLDPSWNVTYAGVGSDTSPFFPQFAVTGDGFFITPTASSTGLFLSGAQEFCNSAFGTTTAGVFGIGTDIANGLCQAIGYLFVPTPASTQQYADLSRYTQTRIPFSYFYQLDTLYGNLIATTSPTFISVELPFSSLGIGSSTSLGNFLPDVDAFSTSTLSTYLSDPVRGSLRFLMSSAVWLLFAYYAYGVVTRMMSNHR